MARGIKITKENEVSASELRQRGFAPAVGAKVRTFGTAVVFTHTGEGYVVLTAERYEELMQKERILMEAVHVS